MIGLGRRIAFATLAIGVIAGLEGAWAEEPKRGGILNVAVTAEPPTTDCHASGTFATIHHVAPHYSTLLKVDAERYPEIVGDVAQSWEVAADGLTYVFKLRPNVVFHDGTPFTSADVRASWERLKNPPEGIASLRKETFSNIRAIEVPDAGTVVIRVTEKDQSMPAIFASPWNCLYSAAKLKSDPRYPEKTVMGTGPFRFVERVPGSHWVGERFEKYFVPGQPYLDGFRNVLLSSSALINSLQGGQVDVEFRGVTPAERDRLVQALGPKIKAEESPFLIMLLLAFNTERPPFNDARVRRALSLAIDRWSGGEALGRTTILKHVGGMLRPGYALAPEPAELEKLPGWGRSPAASREEARRLLKEAGIGNLSFKLANRSIAQPYGPLAVYLIDQWRQIGVTVEQVSLETAAYFNTLANGTFDVAVEFQTDYIDDPSVQWTKYLSHDRSNANSARYIDREVDSLFDRQRRAGDAAERRQLLRQLEARVIEQGYWAPLFWYQRIVMHGEAVKGWRVTPSYLINQDYATIWLAR
ncbi:MAG: ABC transporter substrate-binding protein [Proteobacteria bacterium]|nr:ABC transporter substrate-binding protein [Pseudomonadota bacterium]MBI3495846.1 ABC transporter substrate-binding protein [Pseudomonadota bacterium]